METLRDKPSTSAAVNPERENARVRLVDKYKEATEKLVKEQQEKVKEMKNRTPLQGLLSTHRKKEEEVDTKPLKLVTETAAAAAADGVVAANSHLNPFKAMAAAASEWMESMGGMFPYMPAMIPGMAAPFRPPFVGMPRGMLAAPYRGMPRMRGAYFPRGRGRGGYDPHYNSYRHQTEELEGNHEAAAEDGKYYPYAYGGGRFPRGRRGGYKRGGKDYYHFKKHSHRHHRSHSRSRSRSTSYSRSRSYDRRHYSKRSRSHSSYSRSRSRSHSHSRSDKPSRKLVSTRRSRTVSYSSRSRSHSRSHSRHTRSRQHSSRRHSRRNSERSNSQRSSRRQRSLALETDELVRDAEVIKRTIETEVQSRMREEEREIKRKFRPITYNQQTNEHRAESLELREKSLENERVADERRSRSRSRSYVETKHRKDRRNHSSRSCSADEE